MKEDEIFKKKGGGGNALPATTKGEKKTKKKFPEVFVLMTHGVDSCVY